MRSFRKTALSISLALMVLLHFPQWIQAQDGDEEPRFLDSGEIVTLPNGDQYRLENQIGMGGNKTPFLAVRIHPPCPKDQSCYLVVSRLHADAKVSEGAQSLYGFHRRSGSPFLRGEFGLIPQGQWSSPILISEYSSTTLNKLHGLSLHAGTSSETFLAQRIIAEQLYQGITEIHQTGKLHGDIKPSNVFLSSDSFNESISADDLISGRAHLTLGDFDAVADNGKEGLSQTPLSFESPEARSPSHFRPHLYLRNQADDVYAASLSLFQSQFGYNPKDAFIAESLDRKVAYRNPSWAELIKNDPEIYARYLHWIEKRYENIAQELLQAGKNREATDLKALKQITLGGLQLDPQSRPTRIPPELRLPLAPQRVAAIHQRFLRGRASLANGTESKLGSVLETAEDLSHLFCKKIGEN